MTRAASPPLRLAVFASGGGSNFQAILDAIARGDLAASIALCVSNKSEAGVLAKAAKAHIPTTVLDPSAFADEADYLTALSKTLAAHDVNFIALAGYMRKIPEAVVHAFAGRMLNIHPALLPAFGGKGMYGKRVHEAVIAAGVKESGATVHLVNEEFDTGPIVLQASVPVLPDDTAQTLAARVLKVEHRIYPAALQLFAENRIQLDGHQVFILPKRPFTDTQASPLRS